MLRALLPVAAIAAMTFSANAYEGPHPGDLALSDDMCNEVCDLLLVLTDDNRQSCAVLCDDMSTCRSNYSQDGTKLNDCVSNANRKYALSLKGKDLKTATAGSEGDVAVVTDADNFQTDTGDNNRKGVRDAI